MARRAVLLSSILAVLLCAAGPIAEAGRIYWSEIVGFEGTSSYLKRAQLSGAAPHTILDLPGQYVTGLAIDLDRNQLYWSQLTAPDSGVIYRGGPNGCAEVLESVYPTRIALDPAGSRIYWIEYFPGRLMRAGLDGSNVEQLLALDFPSGVALDMFQAKVYVSQTSQIVRADLDGSNVEVVVSDGAKYRDVAVDPAGGKVYWIQGDPAKVRRADLDGSNSQDLHTVTAEDAGSVIAVDPSGGKVYWTEIDYWDFTPNYVTLRANLDGSGSEQILDGQKGVAQFALDPNDDADVSSVFCRIAVPALGRRGAVALAVLLLAGSWLAWRRGAS